MNIQEILQALPHRYPFLLVDKVLECEPGKRLLAVKNVTVNEPCFTGHFPDYPIFPGVLILEAMAQATGLLAYKSALQETQGERLYLFAGVDKARFKRQVGPGDQLKMEVTLLKGRRGIYWFNATAHVDGALACSAELMTAAQEKQS